MTLPKNTTAFRREAPKYMAALMADFGLEDFQAAGFIGNAGVESSGFTQMQELRPTVKGSKGGLGPFQWTGMKVGSGRRWFYEQWLTRKAAKPGTFEVDYGFLWRELTSSEKATIPALKKTRSIVAATETVMRKFERPGVEHLARRIEWAELALDVWRKSQALPSRAAGIGSTAVRTTEPDAAQTTWCERLLGVKPAVTALVGRNRGDEVLFRQQNRLLAAGYTEVGDPDGVWGRNTRTAVAIALGEQAPGIRPPDDYPLSDEVLAALAKLARRAASADRAEVTVQQLRQRGSTPIKAPVQLVTGGGLLSFLGIGRAIQETGIPERITAVSDQASDILASLQTALGLIGIGFALAYRYWWLILMLLGLYWMAKGVTWALQVRALVRQGSIRQTRL